MEWVVDERPDINYYVKDLLLDTKPNNSHTLNFSEVEFSNHTKLWHKSSDVEIGLKSLLMVPIILLGVFGNGAIIAVVIRVKGMRTCTNLFICNMAIADLMTIVFCSWTIIFYDGFQNFVLGKEYCRLDGFLHVTCLLSSVFSLVVISGDRLLGIVFPFSRRLSKGQAIVIMVAIWVAAMTCGSPLAIWRWLKTRKWKDHNEVWCNENANILKYYWLIILILLVYIPLTVMAVAYTAIIMQLDKYEHQLFLREHPLKMKFRKKVIKVLFMYVLNFMLFWVLFQVVVLYRYFKPQHAEFPGWYKQVFFAGHVLTYAQSAINPIIYGACNESFRRAFRITFQCLYKKNRIQPGNNKVCNQIPTRRRNQEAIDKVQKADDNIIQNGELPQSTQETELKAITPQREKYEEGITPPPNTPTSAFHVAAECER